MHRGAERFARKARRHVARQAAALQLIAYLGREGRELVSAGAITLNGRKVDRPEAAIGADAVRYGRFIVIRKGKKSYHAATLA